MDEKPTLEGTPVPEETSPSEANPVRNEKPRKRRKHKKKHYLLRIVIVLVVIAAAAACAKLPYFQTEVIAVIGNEEVTDEEIIKLSGLQVGDSVFSVVPIVTHHKIKENLYIESVNINIRPPDKIEIVVKERDNLAQFEKDGKFVVTDSKGMVLDISKEQRQTTLIEGLTVTGAEKKETIEIKESGGLDRVLDLITTTDENDLYFKRIVFKDGKVSAYVYDELVCVGKYNDLMSAISSGTLKKVLYDLYQKGTEKGTINVYNNDYCFFTPK